MAEPIGFRSRQLAELSLAPRVEVDPCTGGLSAAIALPLTTGRSGFGPRLELAYRSSGSSSPFGMGWGLAGIPALGISQLDGLPSYDSKQRYVFGGVELVPQVDERGEHQELDGGRYRICVYRSSVESGFTRFERWIDRSSARTHWVTRGGDGSVAVFGLAEDRSSRLCDPDDEARTYQWLCEWQYDRGGNAIRYEYAAEDDRNIDRGSIFERTRAGARFAQRYLQRIRYGNAQPLSLGDAADPDWRFSVVLDHGERRDDELSLFEAPRAWSARRDPFSTFRPGFEIRTYRLCRRILMFHHFPEELRAAATLVGAVHLSYDEAITGTALENVRYTGYRNDGTSSSMAPVAFRYTQSQVGSAFVPAHADTGTRGLSPRSQRLVDLRGEGLPGILFEARGAWYHQPNLGGGRFGPQQLVSELPSTGGSSQLADFDGDGNLDLVTTKGRHAGYYSYDRERECWTGYRAFPAAAQVSGVGPMQMMDLDGRGQADLVSASAEGLVRWRSKGRDGFEPPTEMTTPRSNGVSHAPILGAAPEQHYFLADMTGDGIVDQVRIENGRVEYWPQLGHGVFGAGIVMDGAPIFDHHGAFDPRRLRLVDLDGTGTADLLYLGRGELRFWINAGGNRFVEGGTLRGLPFIDDLDGTFVVDFLGNGTMSLVWSTSDASLHYLPLTADTPPRLLATVDNGLGCEYRVSYGHSARHYLRDAASERPWLTKLPSHRIVVDGIETIDRIGGHRVNSRYEYRDGFFDGIDRAFRGFCLVDRFDVKSTRDDPDAGDASCVRSWFHFGDVGWETRRRRDFYAGDPDAATVGPSRFEARSGGELTSNEYERAQRALAGQLVRSEVYAIDTTGRRAEHPFQVTEASFRVRVLQRARDGVDEMAPCLAVFPLESLTYVYEQEPSDPRIAHALTLAVDDRGHATRNVTIAYPRRAGRGDEIAAQRELRIELVESRFTHVDEAQRLVLNIPLETRRFEVAGLVPSTIGPRDAVFRVAELEPVAAALDRNENIRLFHEPFTSGVELRLVQWERLLYWNDGLDAAAPWSEVGRDALVHHKETACFTEPLVRELLEGHIDAAATGYHEHDAHWWQDSAIVHYTSFHLVSHETRTALDGVETVTTFRYDAHHLMLAELRDPIGNRVEARHIDYHWMAPDRIVDANDNLSEVAYDPLGVAIVATEHGLILDGAGGERLYGNEPIDRYTRQPATFDEVLREPERFLQRASSYLYYDFDTEGTRPARTISLAREAFVYPYATATTSEIRVAVCYVDGFGRVIQNRERMGPGDLDFVRDDTGTIVRPTHPVRAEERWRASGFLVHDDRQQAVRAYEPFVSATHELETDDVLRAFGSTTVTRYDALGRVVEIAYPDKTRSRIAYGAWERRVSDRNDNVVGTEYESSRAELPASDPERIALDGARRHAGTAVRIAKDPLGRDVVTFEDGGDAGTRRIDSRLDFDGRLQGVVDARRIASHETRRDMLGRALFQRSTDAGGSWTWFDATGQLVYARDALGVEQRLSYDRVGRLVTLRVAKPDGTSWIAERYAYGDAPETPQATLRNARGRWIERHDEAGVERVHIYDRSGTALYRERTLVASYRSEPDWTEPSTVDVGPEVFTTRTELDGLGRLAEQALPDGTTRRYTYQRGGGVVRVVASSTDGQLADRVFLSDAVYNARGQRTRAVLGDGAGALTLDSEYDPTLFRLRRLHAHASRSYQDLRYAYDPVGNVVHAVDQSRAGSTDAGRTYTYDPLYRLTRATGRVHRALEEQDAHREAPEVLRGARRIDLEDLGQLRRYQQSYRYDLAGNLQEIAHTTFGIGTEGDHGWTSHFWVSGRSNRALPAYDASGIAIERPEERFDANGNCLYFPHLGACEWSWRGHLARAVVIARDDGRDDAEYYTYDAGGRRIRRVTERLQHDGITIEEKIYLDGCELKRIRSEASAPILERWTSHVSDGKRLLARVHRWTHDRRALETDDLAMRVHFVLGDHVGSATQEVSDRGELISYEEYFPYGGTAYVESRNRRDVVLKDYRYSGKERDDATGFYYYGLRYYAPWLGRWISPDPAGIADGPNAYAFVHGNPVTFRDLDGTLTEVLVPASQFRGTFLTVHQEWLRRRDDVDRPPGTTEMFNIPREGEWEEFIREREREEGVEYVLFIYDPVQSRLLDEQIYGLAPDPNNVLRGSTGGNPDAESHDVETPLDVSDIDVRFSGNDAANPEQMERDLDAVLALDGGGRQRRNRNEGGSEHGGGTEQRGGAEQGSGRQQGGRPGPNGGGHAGDGQDDHSGGHGGGLGGDGSGLHQRGRGRGGGGTSDEVGIGGGPGGRGVGNTGQGTGAIGGSGRGRGTRGRVGAQGQNAGATGQRPGTPGGGNGGGIGGSGTTAGGVPGSDASTAPTVPPESMAGTPNAQGTRDGLEGSSGHGGLTRGDGSTGSRLGDENGSEEGSWLTGDENGHGESDLGDRIVAAVAIANMDFIGYDPNDPNARDSGTPGGTLGWLDFGETANQTLYVVGTIAMMVLGGVNPDPPPPRPSGRIRGWLGRAFNRVRDFVQPHIDEIARHLDDLGRWIDDVVQPISATARLQVADRTELLLDMGGHQFEHFFPWHARWTPPAGEAEAFFDERRAIPGMVGAYSPGNGIEPPTMIIRPSASVRNAPPNTDPLLGQWVNRGGGHAELVQQMWRNGNEFRDPRAFTLLVFSPQQVGSRFNSQSVNEVIRGGTEVLPAAEAREIVTLLRGRFPSVTFWQGPAN